MVACEGAASRPSPSPCRPQSCSPDLRRAPHPAQSKRALAATSGPPRLPAGSPHAAAGSRAGRPGQEAPAPARLPCPLRCQEPRAGPLSRSPSGRVLCHVKGRFPAHRPSGSPRLARAPRSGHPRRPEPASQEAAMRCLHWVPGCQAQPAPGHAHSTHTSGQSFEPLRWACRRKGVLFEDAHFPNSSSLFYSERPPVPFEWRPPGVRAAAQRPAGGGAREGRAHAPHAPATDRTCVCWHTRLVGCAGGPRGVGLHPPSALSPSEARPEGAGPSCSQDNSQETRPSGPRVSLQTWRGPPNSSPCEVTLRPPCTGLSGFWPDTPSAGAQDRGEAPPLGGEPSAAQRPAGDGPMGASQCLGRGANVCCAALARARPLTQYHGSPSPGWLLWGQVTMGQAGTAKSQPLSCRERSL